MVENVQPAPVSVLRDDTAMRFGLGHVRSVLCTFCSADEIFFSRSRGISKIRGTHLASTPWLLAAMPSALRSSRHFMSASISGSNFPPWSLCPLWFNIFPPAKNRCGEALGNRDNGVRPLLGMLFENRNRRPSFWNVLVARLDLNSTHFGTCECRKDLNSHHLRHRPVTKPRSFVTEVGTPAHARKISLASF